MLFEGAAPQIASLHPGWYYLPLHTVLGGACSCGRPNCPSPGKHPRTDLAPHGLHDATTDPAIVERWNNANIGVVLGHGGLMAFDVDSREVVDLLRNRNLGTLVSETGSGGLHIWFTCTGSTRTSLVRSRGEHIGEIRGSGAYVVAPPSMGIRQRYRWLNDLSPIEVPDAGEWVAALLGQVGVAVAPQSESVPLSEEDWRDLEAVSVPPAYARLLAPPWEDRSGLLYRLACEVVEDAQTSGNEVTLPTLAGIVKAADKVLEKYADRHDANRYYLTIAQRVLSEHSGPQVAATDYLWDDTDGWIYYHPSPRVMRKVCNFRIRILQDVTVDEGDHQERLWILEVSRTGAPVQTFPVPHVETKALSVAIEGAVHQNCPVDYIISYGMGGHLLPAAQHFSDRVEHVRAVGSTGWVEFEGEVFYVLPGSEGGIGASSIERRLRIEPTLQRTGATVVSEALTNYGVGVRPPRTIEETAAAWEAFEALVTCGDPGVTLPIVLQVLLGPLARAGVGRYPPLLHVTGRTGTFKTTYTLCALSLFGNHARHAPPANWHSTVNSIRALLYTARDVTLLIDDYKTVGADRGVPSLVNTYTDRSGRQRLSGSQDLQRVLLPRGIILSNGEDIWERVASATARTLVIDLNHATLDIDRITAVQDWVHRGALQMFGGAYLSFLARHPKVVLEEGLVERLDKRTEEVGHVAERRYHPRLYTTLACLLVGSEVLMQFVRSLWPEKVEVVSGWTFAMQRALLGQLEEYGVEVEETSPLNLLLEAVSEALTTRLGCLRPANYARGGRDIPATGHEVVGVWLDGGATIGGRSVTQRSALLTRNTTYQWYANRAARAHASVEFAWRAVQQEAEVRWPGSKVKNVSVWDPDGTRHNLAGILIPLDTLVEVSVLTPDSTESVGMYEL